MYPWIAISDDFQIPSYVLVISLVYTGLLFWVVPRARQLNLDSRVALDFSLAIMIGGFLGARFFHVAYEHPDFYLANPLEIVKVWNGGFVFYGGFFGALFTSLFVSRLHYINDLYPWLDLFAPIVAAGYALGRWGCFLAGCCYGEVCDLPWAVTFPYGSDAPNYGSRHPTQIYAFAWEILLMALLLWLEKRGLARNRPGRLFFVWMGLHSIGRMIMEAYREDFRGPTLEGWSISTVLSLMFLALSLIWVVASFFSRQMTPPGRMDTTQK